MECETLIVAFFDLALDGWRLVCLAGLAKKVATGMFEIHTENGYRLDDQIDS